MAASCHLLKRIPRKPITDRPATALLLLLLVIPSVFSAGRVLFPGSDVRSEVTSEVTPEFSSLVRSGVRSEVTPGGSEWAFWLWRGSTSGQSGRQRPPSVADASPPQRPHRNPTRPTAPRQEQSARPASGQGDRVVESRPARPTDQHPVSSRLVVSEDQPGAGSGPVIEVPSVPSVILEGLGSARNADTVHTPTQPGRDALISASGAVPHGDPQPTAGLPRPLGGEVARIPTSVRQPTSANIGNGVGTGLDGVEAIPAADVFAGRRESHPWKSSPPDDASSEGGQEVGEEGMRGRGLAALITDGSRVGRSHSSPAVLAGHASHVVTSHTDAIANVRHTNSPPGTSQPVSAALHKDAGHATVTSHVDALSVTSPTLTIDGGSSPVYYNSDVAALTLGDGIAPQEPRSSAPPGDDANAARVLLEIASLKRGGRQRHVNEVEDKKPDKRRLVLEPHRCPKLGGNLTLECRVDPAADGTSIQRFRWGKRHFDLHDGLVGDELIAVDGRTFSDGKIRIQTVRAGHQRLVVADVTAEDGGLYLCQVSLQGVLLRTQVTVVLCRR